MMQTREEIRDELLAKGLHLPEYMNYDRETLAEIKWLHTGEITSPFINWYRVNILGLEAVDESRIEEAIKMMGANKKSMKSNFNFKRGDLVMPSIGSSVVLVSGSYKYDHAMVLFNDPFTLVSEDGDMRWDRHYRMDFIKIGRASIWTYLRCWLRRCKG
jgi:hypothetical protein